MSAPIDLGDSVNQGTTYVITREILDTNDTPIPQANLTTLVLTLYERTGSGILNARDHVDVKSMVDAAGLLTLELTPADNVMLTGGAEEFHVVLLEWTYNGGSRRGSGELVFRVRRVPKAA